MSYSPPNYCDGVPVKISERFKPPKRIQLPTKLIQRLANTEIPVKFEDDYQFNLERTIISRTTDWTNLRIRERNERQERIQRKEQQRKEMEEQRQKVKLNQVSYPSTDDLTSSCDEEEKEAASNNITVTTKSIPAETFSPTNFDSILIPTVFHQDTNPSSTLSSTIMATTSSVKKMHKRYASNSSNKIDFSYFESDSSPFDHAELKSMNEMDILAQVLNVANKHSSPTDETIISDNSNLERNNSSESDSDNKVLPNNNNVEIIVPPVIVGNIADPQYQQINTSLQYTNPQTNYVPEMYSNHNYYGMSGGNYYAFNNGAVGINSSTSSTTATPNHIYNQHQNYYYTQQQPQHNYAPSFPIYTNNYGGMINNNNNIISDSNPYSLNTKTEQQQSKNNSKSKSVPDIIAELNKELNNSEMRRTRNISQSITRKEEEISEDESPLSDSQSQFDEEFSKLSIESQKIVERINSMGFPKHLVVRVASKIQDDKKIIEHLIPLNELLSMGFEENRISDALIKFDNNKDKALDFLIS
ncbi:unnamed protein product [Diamesa tonsa]